MIVNLFMHARAGRVSGRAAFLAAALFVGTVTSACGNLLLPSTLAPSVGLSNSTTDAAVVGKPVGFVVTTTYPGNQANVFVTNIHIDFGDGVSADLGAVAGTVSHPYAAAGVYIATATVTDTTGTTGRATLTVYVNDLPRPPGPSVGLTSPAVNPTIVGTVISFSVTATAFSVAGASNFIQAIHLDFGDGQSVDLGGAAATVTHVYATPGTFLAVATATDTNGAQGRATLSTTVSAAPRPATPSVGLFFVPSTPEKVTFTITASIPGNPPGIFIRNIHLDFGDGQSVELGGAAPSSGVVHTYSAPGTYVVTAIATDTNGNEGRASLTVIVK